MSDRLLDLQHAIKCFLAQRDFFSDASAATPIALVSISLANPGVAVCEEPHGLGPAGMVVNGTIAGVAGGIAPDNVNGPVQVTVIDATRFSIGIDVTAAGTGGTFTPTPIPIVTEDNQDVTSQIEQELANSAGISVLIRVPGGKIPSGDNAVAVYNPALVHVRVYENTTINRGPLGTRQPGCKVADAVIRMVYGQTMPTFNAPLVAKSRAWGTEQDIPFHDVIFETVVPLDGNEPTRNESLIEPLVTESGENIIAE